MSEVSQNGVHDFELSDQTDADVKLRYPGSVQISDDIIDVNLEVPHYPGFYVTVTVKDGIVAVSARRGIERSPVDGSVHLASMHIDTATGWVEVDGIPSRDHLNN